MNRERIEDSLIKMGISVGIKGFEYIVDAVEMLSCEDDSIKITKTIYPGVARKRNTTEKRVERNIRHAFNLARSCKANYDIVNYYIGFSNVGNFSSLKQLVMMLKREEEHEN